MAQTCTKCSRVNPPDASYCYFDGSLLEGHSQNGGAVRAGSQNFPSHFVFPSGLICRNFDQLAQACQDNWSHAVELLKEGYLERFFGGLGRVDLAFAAREASRFPDRDRGLDQLLAKIPSHVLDQPKLAVEPREINLGILQVGDNRQFELHLANNGSRLLYGNVTVDDCKWLTLGEAPGTSQKVFQFGTDLVIPVQVRGANLRAGTKPLEGKLLVESNGGNSTITVRCEVPVKAFGEGVLAGARSPRQIAEKAKAAPKEAAVLFERGAVADWYKANGWTYPVQGPSAAGLGAVQQFFEALGLTAPPKVDINEKFITFQGAVGARLQHTLEVKAQEKRPVFAYGTSDQPWLVVERANLNGRTATIGVTVPSVPNRPGEILQGKVTVTSNGNQRFVVPVTLAVSGSPSPYQQPQTPFMMIDEPAAAPIITDVQVVQAPMAPIMPTPVIPSPVFAPPGPPPMRPSGGAPVMVEPVIPPRRQSRQQSSFMVHLIPAGVLVLVLLGMVVKDVFTKKQIIDDPGTYPIDPDPRVALQFEDDKVYYRTKDPATGKIKEQEIQALERSMRFGIHMPGVADPVDRPENPTKFKCLTFFPEGISNNTCLKIDGEEFLLGSAPKTKGKWINQSSPLGKTKDGRQRIGRKSVYLFTDEKIQVTQIVEVVPSDEPSEVTKKGETKLMRLLDTVLVRYEIENQDTRAHDVGIRFLLDTFIGSNDGVPFLIPGQTTPIKTKMDFDPTNPNNTGRAMDPKNAAKPASIPDYIQALENPDPKNPGTIARVSLKLGGKIEAPTRVTLGAWPHSALRFKDPKAREHMTMWEVPFLSMEEPELPKKDSAVVMYWNPQSLAPKKTRQVGFAYGLGDVSASGKLALTVTKPIVVNQEFTVTVSVTDPEAGQKVTVKLPEKFELAAGESATQSVPANAGGRESSVTWKVTASVTGRHEIKVSLENSNVTAKKYVTVVEQDDIFK